RIVLGIFAAIGIIAALTVLGTGIAVWRIASSRPALPKSIILTAELGRDLLEGPRQNEVSELLTGRKQTMRGFLDAIERAAEDSRVRGLYAHIDGDSLGLAKVQELRDAVQAFRARGKFAIAFSESFGEFGGGTRPYYLATAFDEIWLQPLGAVGLTGLRAESPFLRGLLDRIGISSIASATATRRSPRRIAAPVRAPSCCRCRAISRAPAGRIPRARRSR